MRENLGSCMKLIFLRENGTNVISDSGKRVDMYYFEGEEFHLMSSASIKRNCSRKGVPNLLE